MLNHGGQGYNGGAYNIGDILYLASDHMVEYMIGMNMKWYHMRVLQEHTPDNGSGL